MHLSLSLTIATGVLTTVATAIVSPHLEMCPRPQTADPPNEHGKPPKNGLKGDALEVTRCYCEATTFDSWGFWLEADYFNYHQNVSYTAQYVCASRERTYPAVPECWDISSRMNKEVCETNKEDNKFCYKMEFTHSILQHWALVPSDMYFFNNQKRAVSLEPNYHLEPAECDLRCADWLGMLGARDDKDTWKKTIVFPKGKNGTICSSKQVWTDLDDMCWNCKKEE